MSSFWITIAAILATTGAIPINLPTKHGSGFRLGDTENPGVAGNTSVGNSTTVKDPTKKTLPPTDSAQTSETAKGSVQTTLKSTQVTTKSPETTVYPDFTEFSGNGIITTDPTNSAETTQATAVSDKTTQEQTDSVETAQVTRDSGHTTQGSTDSGQTTQALTDAPQTTQVPTDSTQITKGPTDSAQTTQEPTDSDRKSVV